MLLAAVAAALFGPQVADGGFYWDDWQNSANTHFSREPGLFGALESATERPVFGYRPVLTTLLVLEHEALGRHVWLHLAMAVLFGVLVAWALYLLLRTLGFKRLDSAVPAALLLAFPWVDSTRFWATASYDTLAVALYLLGLGLAVRGLRAAAPGRRSRARWLTLASLALYLAAAWTYEIMAVGVLASVFVYLLAAPRRAALRRFAIDVLLVAIALALVASGTTRDPLSLGDQLDHARVIAGQSFTLFARAVLPLGDVPGAVGAVLLAGVFLIAWRRRDRWAALAAGGVLYVCAGYVLFVPALPHYQPLEPGTTNRMNVLAAVGFVVLVYALARMVAGRRSWLAAGLCALVGIGYVVKVVDDRGGWERSAREQERVLGSLPRAVSSGTTLYTFGAPTFAAANVPVFSLPFDLKAAARLRYDDASIAAYPLAARDGVACGRLGLYPTGGSYGPVHGEEYGHALLVDVRTGRATPIANRAECRAWEARLGGG